MAFDASKSKLLQQGDPDTANPANPAGLTQTYNRLATDQGQYESGATKLRPWMPENSMLETAKSWYAGANSEGVTNGWDSDFYRNSFAQIDQWQTNAMAANGGQGKGSVFYNWLDPTKNRQATGVQTWGADPTDEVAKSEGRGRFGDVYNNGEKVGNVYDDHDKATADVLMGEFLFSNEEKERMFKDPNRNQLYATQVEDRRRENTDRQLYSRSAEDYDDNVRAKEVALWEGKGNEATVAGATAGGAALGAGIGFTIGSFVPVIGNVLGAAVGGGIGALAGLAGGVLNQDQLVEMTARSQAKADIANQMFGDDWLARTSMKVGEYSHLGTKFISPFSNIWQGQVDARSPGGIGDMSNEFYAVDAEGNRKVSGWVQGGDIVATLLDSVLQFGSPTGRWMYMGTMAGVTGGKIGEMITGSVFNERRGTFDSLDGWQEWTAAVGSTAIDAVQVGVAGGFAKAARASRAAITGESAVTAESVQAVGRFQATTNGPVSNLYNRIRGKEAPVGVTTSGLRFTTDVTGTHVQKIRPALSMLAPSEFLRWIPTGFNARRLARIDGGEMTRDHMLRASLDLTGNTKFRNAVIMGYAEGGEEFAQAYLDPARFGETAKFGDAFNAFLYGAASGAGMALGPANRGASSRQQLESQAYVQHAMRTGHFPTDDEWAELTKDWSKKDFEKVARSDEKENKDTHKVLAEIAGQQRQERAHHSSIGFARMEQVKMGRFEALQKKALEQGNGSLVLLGQTSEFLTTPDGRLERNKFSANAGVMSAYEAVKQLGLIAQGHQTQLDKVREELGDTRALFADATGEKKEHFSGLLQEMTAREADLVNQVNVSKQVSDKILEMYQLFINEQDATKLQGHIDAINERLVKGYTGVWDDNSGTVLPPDAQRYIQRAIELKMGRHPFQDKGSFTLLMPQISSELTKMGAEGTLYVQQGMLKALGADHDGDTSVPLHAVYMNEDNLQRFRRGDQYMFLTQNPDGSEHVELVIAAPDGEWAFVQSFADAMLDSTSASATTTTQRLDGLIKDLKAEFSETAGGFMDDTEFDDLLSTFKESVLAGREDARMNLVSRMANINYEAMRTHKNRAMPNVPNVQMIWSTINSTWDILQKDLAHVRSTESTNPTIDPQREAQETSIRDEIARQDAATASATLGLLASDPVRGAQFLHYSALYRALTEVDPNETMTTDQQLRLTELFMELGNGQTERDIDLITGRNAVTERVYYWLEKMANSVKDTSKTTPEVMLLLSNLSVPAAKMVAPNEYQVQDGQITMLQLLLRRSIDIETAKNEAAEPDSDIMKRLNKLRRMTVRDPDPTKHSYTPSLAMIEVFGDRPLHELIGKSSSYISPQITLNQMIQQQRGLHPDTRGDEIHRLKRQSPYIKDKDRPFKDAPWPLSAMTAVNPETGEPMISAFAILVDAVKVAGDTYVPNMKARDKTIQDDFILGIKGLQKMIAAHRVQHSDRLGKGTSEIDNIRVLRDMLATNQDLAVEIAKLIPEAAALGVFQVHKDNSVTASKWLEKMLVTENAERAAAIYYFNIKMAEFIVRGGTVDLGLLDEDVDKKEDVILEDVRGRIDPTTLKSRFQQVLFHLASQPDSIELMRFLKAMNDAPSVDAMFRMINTESTWRNNQAELLPWHDDVALFEVDPADVWNSQLEGSVQRENIRGWGKRMQILGAVAVEAETNYESNKDTLHGMDQWVKTRNTGKEVNLHDGALNLSLLKRALELRKKFPDVQGQAVRAQLVELQQMGLAAVQNKGKADPKAAPFGEPLITMDSFGFSDGLRQAINSITAEDVEDVRTNLTLLVEGPVRIQLEDGKEILFDITDEVKALEMLMDPRTQGLAMAIIFDTVRDVNNNNVVQVYLDTDSKGNLAKMLQEQNFKHLFHDYANFGEQLKQAHRYLGKIEGYIRRDAVNNGTQGQDFHPIQQMVHDFITAYTHSKDIEGEDAAVTRDRLFIDLVDAIKAVASVHEDNRGTLKERIAKVLEERFLKDSTQVDRMLRGTTVQKQFYELKAAEREFDIYQKAVDDLATRRKNATTDAQRAAIDQERADFLKEYHAMQRTDWGYPHQTFLNAASALNMFKQLSGPTVMYQKTAIMAFLSKQNRIHSLEKKGNQALYHKMLRIYDHPLDVVEDSITEAADWEVLAGWAAELYLYDTTSRSSSSVPKTAALVGEDAAALQRYFDQSFMYLTDTLFDSRVLEAADLLSQGGTHYRRRESKDVASMLLDGILSEKRLGTWTEVIVNESMKTRMVQKNSPVGAAVAQEGSDPVEMADYIGGGRVTWAHPDPGHFSTADLTGTKDQRLWALLTDNLAHVKLENHFVTSVIIQSTDPSKQLDPAQADVLGIVTSINHTSSETTAAGQIMAGPGISPSQSGALRVLDLDALDSQIEWLKSNHQLGDYTVHIEYVDVTKRPHERKWANNIFFDGAGRETVGGSGMGAVASLFFGLNALNKVGQQNPLDMATKKGMGFKAFKRITMEQVKQLEASGTSVAEILAAKAVFLAQLEYPTGELLRADLPSLYKLMEMRHVIVGFDANGKKEVWWPQKLIAMQQAGTPIPLQNWKLVSLSDSNAQTLWGKSGKSGVKGTPGSMLRPTFNIQDLDVFPSLDAAYLKSVGLEGLGETGSVANSRLAQVMVPPVAVVTDERGKEWTSLYKKRLKEWRGELLKVGTRRARAREQGTGKIDIGQSLSDNMQIVIDMLNIEKQGVTSQRLGIPGQGVVDLAALQVSRRLAAQISKMMENENNMAWVYRHGLSGDLAKGYFGRADIQNNFAGFDGMGVTFGDVVVIDLTDIQNSVDVRNTQEAAKVAGEIIKELAKKGVTVCLQSTRGQIDLRAKVVEDLVDGSLGYRPMAESAHFFVPITEEADFNAAQRATASTLLETQQLDPRNVALRIVSDDIATSLTEGTEMIDGEHDRAYNTISHTILPYKMLSTGSVGRRIPLSFNAPQRGTGRADQLSKVNAQLLALLKDPEGRRFLKELLGPENKYPKYTEHPNGDVQHGVLTLDMALDKLQQTVEAGKWPLDKTQTFYWGTIVPFVSGDGSIHLSRIGFKQPGHKEMRKQHEARYHDKPLKFTAATHKLDSQQTLPPPTTVDEVRPDGSGLSVVGTYKPGDMAKMISEGIGLKSGFAWMTKGFRFPDAVIGAVGAAGMRVTRLMGSTSVVGKEAKKGLVNNFRDGFAVSGISFEDDMIDYFFGEDPNRSEQKRAELLDMTTSILKEWAAYPHPYTAVELSRILDNRSAMVLMEAKINAIGETAMPGRWRGVDLRSKGTSTQKPKDRLGTVILTALAAPGVKVEHVLSTPGLTTVKDLEAGNLVRLMPALMTDALNDPGHPDLRKMLIARMNRNMPTDANGRMLYWFDNQLKFHSRMEQDIPAPVGSVPDGVFQRPDGTWYREEEIVGFLQVHIPIPADENSLRLTYSSIDSKGTESQHIADTIAEATGGRLATKTRKKTHRNLPDQLDEVYGENVIERFEDEDTAAAAFYYMLTRLRMDNPEYSPWQRRTPMEEVHIDKMRGKLKQYTYFGERNEKTGWSPSQIVTGDRLATDFLKKLNITDPKAVAEVAYLVRQLFGIPGPAKGQDDYVENLTFDVFQSGVEYMKRNIKEGLHPLEGGVVPCEHEVFWKMVQDAQQGLKPDQQWLPLKADNKVKEYAKADDWGDWVDALHGQWRASSESFNSRFRTDLDAFYSTYQGTHPDYMEMAISTDQQWQAKLIHPETNRPYLSIDPGRDAVLREPIVLASQHMLYDALVGQGAVITMEDAEEAAGSVLAKRISVMEAWQRGEGLPKQRDMSIKEYARNGAAYQESQRTTNNVLRNTVNASIMMRLFNPALYFSAMFEVPFRSSIEGFTNVLTGQMTGTRGKAAAGVSSWLEKGLNKGDDQWFWTEKLKIDGVHVAPRYSKEDIDRLNQLNRTMGESNRFLGLVYGELAYQSVIGGGRGKLGEKLERGAAAVARATADPKWGMKSTSLAKRYNDAVWEYLSMTRSQITIEQYAHLMKEDPTWLEKLDPRAHQMGLNAVKQARGAKATMIGNGIMRPIDRMTQSENLFYNGAGHLLKIPFVFTRFNANMMVSLTGLHGLDQMTAMFFDGRQKPQIVKRLLNRAKLGEFDVNTPEYWDNTDVIESIDLSRAFVRGAVTQTGLMAMAMMAGGFSLGGEDAEERRRKRLATYLNTPYYHDPNKASNDFRWTDAIFLDNVPVLGNIFRNETGHAAVAPHWIFRQFLSPVLGMMRFFETGNAIEIVHGFRDAASVLPNSITRLWHEADLTGQLLIEAAADDELIPEKQHAIAQLFTNFVFIYEKALFENAFINGLYQSRDEFDRNPWAIAATEDNGDITREEGTGRPLPTDALQAYQKGEGEEASNRVGYMTRHGIDATLHQYSEGNATAALALSILPWLSGDESTYLRQNMVTKKQRVQVDETDRKQMEALVYSTYLGRGGQPLLTKEELIGQIKQREQAADRFWDQAEVEAEADKRYEAYAEMPLTVFDNGGKEIMTQDGKTGVFRSLRDGVFDLDNPAIMGFNMSQAERDVMAEELTTELVQEGVDLGLSDQAAMFRMRRIWFGDSTNSSLPGLREILYDKRIPDKPYVEYEQLNVTYVLGPDGKPWATPFTKSNALQVLGVPLPHQMAPTIPGVTKLDARGNVIDLIRGINTGQAALVPRPVAQDIEPKDDAVAKAENKTYSPGGGRRYGRGGGGGYDSNARPYFQRMQPLPSGTAARLDNIPMINTSNPIIRRADVRRERFSSERGRLKQWQ